MTRAQHEPETLAAQTQKLAIAAIAQPRDLTVEETVDAMLPAVIERATDYAEKAFLAVVASADHLPGHITAGHVDWITLSALADMQHEAGRIADELQATPEQRHRLMMGQAAIFDLRMAELQAHTVLEGGMA